MTDNHIENVRPITSQDDSAPTGSAPPDGGGKPRTPKVVGTDAKPPPDGEPPITGAHRSRAHRFLVPVLLVLATIIGIPAAFAVWINRQALNTANWASTSSKILEDQGSRPPSAPTW